MYIYHWFGIMNILFVAILQSIVRNGALRLRIKSIHFLQKTTVFGLQLKHFYEVYHNCTLVAAIAVSSRTLASLLLNSLRNFWHAFFQCCTFSSPVLVRFFSNYVENMSSVTHFPSAWCTSTDSRVRTRISLVRVAKLKNIQNSDDNICRSQYFPFLPFLNSSCIVISKFCMIIANGTTNTFNVCFSSLESRKQTIPVFYISVLLEILPPALLTKTKCSTRYWETPTTWPKNQNCIRMNWIVNVNVILNLYLVNYTNCIAYRYKFMWLE